MDIINRINYTSFLGREFLTWVWYRSELQDGVMTLGSGPIEVWFDAKMTLESPGDLKEQSVIKAEHPTETDEVRAAIQSGKQVVEARLRVIDDQKQWTLTVKADTLAMTSVKIPALLSRDEDDLVYERFYLMEEVEDHFDALFGQFIELRLDDDAWREELDGIRRWVHGVDAADGQAPQAHFRTPVAQA